jgi:hypothetical protein
MTISNPADRKKIRDALQEISNSMTRVDAEKDFIKDAVTDISDNFKLSKKTVNKLARVYHKQNFNQEVEQYQEFENLYEEVVVLKSGE